MFYRSDWRVGAKQESNEISQQSLQLRSFCEKRSKTRSDNLQGQALFRGENKDWPELSGNASQFSENLAFHLLKKIMVKRQTGKGQTNKKKDIHTKRQWDKKTDRKTKIRKKQKTKGQKEKKKRERKKGEKRKKKERKTEKMK